MQEQPTEPAAPVPGADEGEPMNDRTCIVTRQPLDSEAMIRFVAGPGGGVGPRPPPRRPGQRLAPMSTG